LLRLQRGTYCCLSHDDTIYFSHFPFQCYVGVCRLFVLEPAAKVIFGFSEDDTMEDLKTNPKFTNHAKYFIQMIDKALGMLGPDIEVRSLRLDWVG
jgi:hypothetical protein